MAFKQLIKHDAHMNFTLNRILTYGEKAADFKEIEQILHRIKDYDSWFKEWQTLAETACDQERFLHAAYYFRLAEFYLEDDGRLKNQLYKKSRAAFDKALAKENLERHEIPYQGTFLPALAFEPAPGAPVRKETILMHGGYDSFMEEFIIALTDICKAGYRVILFEGPGQGQALKNGLKFTHEWEKPVAAVLDYFQLDAVALIGVSWGGYLAPRAASLDSRIKRVAAYDVLYDGLEVLTNPMPFPLKQIFRFLMKINAKKTVNRLVTRLRQKRPIVDWAAGHGMYITGTQTPYDLYKTLSVHRFKDMAKDITQDVLLLAGEADHLIPSSHLARCQKALTNARSVTSRMFTRAEGGEQHCQVGNHKLAIDAVIQWLDRF